MLISVLSFSAAGATSFPLLAETAAQETAPFDRFPGEIPDPEALNAFRQYWSAFDSYERSVKQESARRFQDAWRQLQKNTEAADRKIAARQLDLLRDSAKKYRRHLKDHPSATNRPFVLLNLAQILDMIGAELSQRGASGDGFARTEALSLLKEIEDVYPGFVHREDAQYLRATILEALDRKDEALRVWTVLATTGSQSIYAVHANIAAGDHSFEIGDAVAALRFFERGVAILEGMSDGDGDAYRGERLRLKYRVAWAAYKAAQLEKVIAAAKELLQPLPGISSTEQRTKMQIDAVELIGDALFEGNQLDTTRATLRRRELMDFAPSIGLRTVQRYINNGVFGEAIKVGEFVIDEYPSARELPDLINAVSEAWKGERNANRQIASLERAALLVPAQSLWRSRHAENLAAVKRMEEIGVAAARAVAAHHYDQGLASGSLKAFASASSFYEILVDHQPNGDDSNTWRLRIANCAYFSNNLDEAAQRYGDLKTKFKLDRATLEVASYQEVLTAEKRWRAAFEKAVVKGVDPVRDEDAVLQLKQLEKSIDEFANRFPAQSRSVDLLLVGASANRDQERFDSASRFWQRALVSSPTPSQRAIAIRGLVFANMKAGSPADVIATAGKFLKLEDWKKLGLTLGAELRGVLSAATLDEGERLNKDGRVLEAGKVMVSIARDFPEVPQRDKIFRDGAYMLAIGGHWAEAEAAANDYLSTNLMPSRGDMIYLLARSHEFQIRLQPAADRYLELAQKYPRHPKAALALERAERLGVADGNYRLAGEAAALLGERLTDRTARLAALKRSVEHLDKTGDAERSVQVAGRRLSASNSLASRYESQLLLAKSNFSAGREQQAIDDLEILAKRLEQQRGELGNAARPLLAEVNFLLGEEARRKFEDFGIFERSGSVNEKVAEKMKLFEELVTRYDKSANAGVPSISPRARYQLGEAAELLADEVASIPTRSGQGVTLKAQSRYNDTIQRLREMARRYFSANLLAQRRDPSAYRGNEWVKRSAIKLSARGEKNDATDLTDQLPAAVNAALPQKWSL